MDGTRENNSGQGAANSLRSVGEAAASAAQRVGDSLEQGRAAWADMQAVVSERTRECVRTTDTYVRENPWQAVGLAAGIGLVIGLLIGRR
jgi:ElaB/YqjD/DUF883 family membrane-anchored ribosome-binding protein